MNKKKSIDMLHGPLTGKIILFALPVALSSMLQQLFNAADTSVVGHFGNANALAAVGTNGEIVALLVTLSAGLAAGANVLIASYIGKGKSSAVSEALHTAIMLAVVSGILGVLLGQFLSRPLLHAIHTPEDILDSAVLYLRIYFLGYPFLMLYDFGSAILRSKGDSRRPFLALTVSGVVNVLLNLFLVIVCRLGVAGVAVATDIATGFSAFLVLFWLVKEPEEFHLSLKKLRIHKKALLSILSTGIPAAIQGAVFCFANIFVQASVNSFGAVATAGSTIAMNFEYFGYYMITAFGQAATTFTSQNFAAGQRKRCWQTLKICLVFSVLFCSVITVPLTVWCQNASRIFSSEQAVIGAACVRILLILIWEPVCCFYEIPSGFLRGMEHSTLPAVLTILGTCVLRIVWIFTVFRHYHTLESLFVIFPISWVVTILLTISGVIYVVIRTPESATSQ